MNQKKFLITGGSGQLAKEFAAYFDEHHYSYGTPQEGDLDITDPGQIERVVETEHPDVLINCAAYNQVDLAEDDCDKVFKVNSDAVGSLASICRQRSIFLVHFSSDYVFDGQKGSPYTEDDKPSPLNVYGASKLKGEENLKRRTKDYLIFRLSWVFGNGPMNFLFKLSQWARQNNQLKIASDEISVPTYTQDVVRVTLGALDKGLKGLYHLTNSGFCSRYEWAKYYFQKKDEKKDIVPVPMASFDLKAQRPPFSAMDNRKIAKELGIEIPSWESGVDRYVAKYPAS